MTSRAKLLILLCIGLVGSLTASPAWGALSTIGDKVAEASVTPSIHNIIRGGIYKMPGNASGLCDSITVYLDVSCEILCTATSTIKAAVYLWRGSGNNATLIDTTATLTIAANTNSVAWYTMATLIHGPVESDSTYLIVCWSPTDADNNHYERHDVASTGDTMSFKSVTFGAWPNPLAGTTTSNTHRVSVYLTYNTGNTEAQAPGPGKCIWGDTIVGASTTSIKGIICTTRTLCPQTATIDSVMTFLQTSGLSTPKAKVAIYVDIPNSHADTLLTNGVSQENTTFTSGSFWRGFNLTPSVTGGTFYLLAAWANATSTTFSERTRVTNSSDSIFTQTLAYTGTFPSPATQAFLITRTLAFEVFYSCNRRRKIIQEMGEVPHDTTQMVRWIENFLPETDDAK